MANGLRKLTKGARKGEKIFGKEEKKKMNSNAVSILSKKYIKKKPKRIASLALEREKSDIAQQIYDLRHQAGLTQKEFAKLVNTTPSVISRLESADYSGYSVNTLRRIAESMHHKLEIKFVPE